MSNRNLLIGIAMAAAAIIAFLLTQSPKPQTASQPDATPSAISTASQWIGSESAVPIVETDAAHMVGGSMVKWDDKSQEATVAEVAEVAVPEPTEQASIQPEDASSQYSATTQPPTE